MREWLRRVVELIWREPERDVPVTIDGAGARDVTIVSLVRLASDSYSVDRGTLGVITESLDVGVYVVWWTLPPGGGSAPVYACDIEPLGELIVPHAESRR